MSDEIRIGVVGAGGIFRRRHLPNLTDFGDASVVAVANRTEESARDVVSEFDLDASVHDDPYDVIENDGVDAVMVGTWPYRHREYGLAALDAGKHTFVQARMARDVGEARDLYDESAETDLVTQICPSPYALEAGGYFGDLVADGYLGDVYRIHACSHSGSRLDPDAPLAWREVARYQGVNALAVAIVVEWVHRWFGHAETVAARQATHVEERPLPEGEGEGTGRVERPNVVHVNARMENGAAANFAFSNVTRAAPGTNRVEAHGSDGTLVYELGSDRILAAEDGEDELSELAVPDDARDEWTVERDFVDAIRGERDDPPIATFEEGLRYMEFTEAVARSVETGGEIRLPLVT